jgi:predicted transcriptional regulator
MDYTKETLKEYLHNLKKDKFAAEVSLEDNKRKLKKYGEEIEQLTKEINKIDKDLEELQEKKKEGIKDKELREQNKGLIQIVESKKEGKMTQRAETAERAAQFERQIKLYEDFLVTADECAEIAKNKV